jgi:aldehyde dehydrogenase (NAD+)
LSLIDVRDRFVDPTSTGHTMHIPAADERRKNLINGQWSEPSTGQYEPCVNPADTRETIGHFPRSGAADAKAAVDAAAAAFPAWSKTPGPERGRVLARAHAILKSKVDVLAEALCREEGKTLGESRGEVMKGLNLVEFYAGEGFRTHGKTLPSEARQTLTMTVRQPVGPVALITPWNFPFAIPVWKTAPALVAGCTVVLKPASLTPICTHLLAEAFVEAGAPAGVINVVTGPGGAVGNALVDDPRIRAVSFTGSNEVGLALYERAAKRGAKVTAEMGGKNPVVVLDDADLDLAAEGIIQGAFGSTGQRCTATSRVVVTAGVAPKLTEALVAKARALRVGDGRKQGIQMGPAVDAGQLRTDLEAIAFAKEHGARLLCGGERLEGDEHAHGFFVAPTIFDRVEQGSRLAREEVFGPVLAIQAARDVAHAFELANDVPFGLASSIYTTDFTTAMRFVDASEVGMVHVNQPTVGGEAQLPFGGVKATGVGEKEMAEEGANFFTHLKTVFLDYTGTRRTTSIY